MAEKHLTNQIAKNKRHNYAHKSFRDKTLDEKHWFFSHVARTRNGFIILSTIIH